VFEKKCVLFGYRDGLWTVSFAGKLYFDGEKRKALFFAAKLALMEEAGVIIENNVPLPTNMFGAALPAPKSSGVLQPEMVQSASLADFRR
jgi:hypothetical protein